ncbi:MAG TPA: hypothetical protein PK349_09630 [Candidatus Hydrogenedentes bacterium]|nr:hypothetical protein [Candidatus Hydrogenedentota bacterium]HOV61308.1 hypothetical protein [Candidatus Hydrogenedentota bacterium]
MKKHVRTISTPGRAQFSAGSVVTIVGTIMSSIGGLLLALAPIVGKL